MKYCLPAFIEINVSVLLKIDGGGKWVKKYGETPVGYRKGQ